MEFQLISVASLMLAVVAVWSAVPCLWFSPFALFVLSGLFGGWLSPVALAPIAAFGAVVRLHLKADSSARRAPTTALLVLATLVTGLHLAPGFETVLLFGNAGPADREEWRGIDFTADKALAGLFLLLAFRDRLCARAGDWTRAFGITALPIPIGIAGVYAAGVVSGYITFDPGAVPAPAVLATLLARNLFFTVIAEEMLFRRIIQSGLAARFRGGRAEPLALLCTSVLFGLAHLPGGWKLALLATLAGAVYGYAFLRSGRIETAMAAHLALNTGQALLFSAPVP